MGDPAEGLSHIDRALAFYDPAVHRPLATRFGHDVGAAALTFRPLALWLLGYPTTALLETSRARDAARETDHIPTWLLTLNSTALTHICCRDHAAAAVHLDECITLAQGKSPFMKGFAKVRRGCVLAQTGKASDAIQEISTGTAEMRAIGATAWGTSASWHLARAYAELGKFDEAWRSISEAITAVETTKERWGEPEVHRTAGEIALMSPQHDAAKAQEYYDRALKVARQQQAKSWELRAAMSLVRLWRDQGKVREARELLAPVYGWFTEGFETRDLKEAKVLLEELV